MACGRTQRYKHFQASFFKSAAIHYICEGRDPFTGAFSVAGRKSVSGLACVELDGEEAYCGIHTHTHTHRDNAQGSLTNVGWTPNNQQVPTTDRFLITS